MPRLAADPKCAHGIVAQAAALFQLKREHLKTIQSPAVLFIIIYATFFRLPAKPLAPLFYPTY